MSLQLYADMVPAAGSIYIGECAPPEIRGQIMTFWQCFYSVGSFIGMCWTFLASSLEICIRIAPQ